MPATLPSNHPSVDPSLSTIYTIKFHDESTSESKRALSHRPFLIQQSKNPSDSEDGITVDINGFDWSSIQDKPQLLRIMDKLISHSESMQKRKTEDDIEMDKLRSENAAALKELEQCKERVKQLSLNEQSSQQIIQDESEAILMDEIDYLNLQNENTDLRLELVRLKTAHNRTKQARCVPKQRRIQADEIDQYPTQGTESLKRTDTFLSTMAADLTPVPEYEYFKSTFLKYSRKHRMMKPKKREVCVARGYLFIDHGQFGYTTLHLSHITGIRFGINSETLRKNRLFANNGREPGCRFISLVTPLRTFDLREIRTGDIPRLVRCLCNNILRCDFDNAGISFARMPAHSESAEWDIGCQTEHSEHRAHQIRHANHTGTQTLKPKDYPRDRNVDPDWLSSTVLACQKHNHGCNQTSRIYFRKLSKSRFTDPFSDHHIPALNADTLATQDGLAVINEHSSECLSSEQPSKSLAKTDPSEVPDSEHQFFRIPLELGDTLSMEGHECSQSITPLSDQFRTILQTRIEEDSGDMPVIQEQVSQQASEDDSFEVYVSCDLNSIDLDRVRESLSVTPSLKQATQPAKAFWLDFKDC